MKRLAALFACGLLVVSAGADEGWREATCGSPNGRWWEAVKEEMRLSFVVGLFEGLVTAGVAADSWPVGFNAGEVKDALDLFYEEPSNLAIPVRRAVDIVSLKSRGAEPAQIERILSLARALAAKGACGGNVSEKQFPTAVH